MTTKTEAAADAEAESEIWQASPSQLVNLPLFVFCLLFFWLVIPIIVALAYYLSTRATQYTLTSQRIRLARGVFNRQVDDLELYRVKDYHVEKPFLLRLFSLGHVILLTSDQTTPNVRLRAISDPEGVADLLREHVEIRRDRKRVSEVDFE